MTEILKCWLQGPFLHPHSVHVLSFLDPSLCLSSESLHTNHVLGNPYAIGASHQLPQMSRTHWNNRTERDFLGEPLRSTRPTPSNFQLIPNPQNTTHHSTLKNEIISHSFTPYYLLQTTVHVLCVIRRIL